MRYTSISLLLYFNKAKLILFVNMRFLYIFKDSFYCVCVCVCVCYYFKVFPPQISHSLIIKNLYKNHLNYKPYLCYLKILVKLTLKIISKMINFSYTHQHSSHQISKLFMHNKILNILNNLFRFWARMIFFQYSYKKLFCVCLEKEKKTQGRRSSQFILHQQYRYADFHHLYTNLFCLIKIYKPPPLLSIFIFITFLLSYNIQ